MRYLTLIPILIYLLTGTALAVHDQCTDCHTIHNSQNGQPVDPANPNGNVYLLRFGSATDLCLSCHATRFGAVLGTNPLAPPPELGAGNFVFLLSSNLNDAANGATNPIPGSAAGHNLNAPAYGLAPDATYAVAPGGTFPSNQMACTSCHNPHEKKSFRILNGAGPVQGGLYTFTAPAPIAQGIALDGPAETNSNHTAYQSGISEWCGNCHGNFHESSHNSRFEHPAGENLDGSIIQQYDRYNGTSNPTSGTHATAYLAALPFEDAAVTTTSTTGPTSSSKVMCLTCHRAHATSAPHAGRWDFNVSLLANDGVVSGSYPIPNPYADPLQRKLCYKCHVNGTD